MVTATRGRSATSNPATNPIQLLEMATSGCVLITSFFFLIPSFFLCPTQSGGAGLYPHITFASSSSFSGLLRWNTHTKVSRFAERSLLPLLV